MKGAYEKVKMMVGMEVEDEEQQASALDNNNDNSFAFMDEFYVQIQLLLVWSFPHRDLNLSCGTL